MTENTSESKEYNSEDANNSPGDGQQGNVAGGNGIGYLKILVDLTAVVRGLVLNLALISILVILALFMYREFTYTSIIVLPVAVPEALSKRGYTSEVFAARISSEMDQINLGATTSISLPHQQIIENNEKIDIQLPGQLVSLRTLVRIIKELVGIEDIRLSIDIVEGSDEFAAQIRVDCRYCIGIQEIVKSPFSDSVDKFIKSISERAMQASQPHVFAFYEFARAEEKCMVSLPCEYDYVIKRYRDVLERPPAHDDAWAYLGLGFTLERLERYDDAIENYKKALKLNPKFAYAYYNWGVALNKLSNYEESIEMNNKAIDLDPNYAKAYSSCGFALAKLDRYREASEMYEKAAELDPRNPKPYNNWGLALAGLGNYEEAIKKYVIAVDLDPKYTFAHINWGVALSSLSRNKEALEKYANAVDLDPNALAYIDWSGALASLVQPKEDKTKL